MVKRKIRSFNKQHHPADTASNAQPAAMPPLTASLNRTFQNMKTEILNDGFTIIEKVFTDEEISNLLDIISQADTSQPTFRKTNDLFAIRQFFKEMPKALNIVFTEKLNSLIQYYFGDNYFVVKAIYFDKPEDSNWFVSYHQDLTISVDKKIDIKGYGPWTIKTKSVCSSATNRYLERQFYYSHSFGRD